MTLLLLFNEKEKITMLKKTITYTDYNGVERTEDFYFNFTKAELAEMEMGTSGGLSERLHKIINSKDVPSIIKEFKEIIYKAYGEKSDDGKRFMKSEDISNGFAQTEAYSILFMELANDADYAATFIKQILPADYVKDIPNTPAVN